MKFRYIPILYQMIALYRLPKTIDQRFTSYLKLIQTNDKKDIKQPLAFFNPMAKDHILSQLLELQTMNFENIIEDTCTQNSGDGKELELYFNLADDVAGGWTTKESTRDKSFEIKPFLKRGFCVVVFFASEDITPQLIKNRTLEYIQFYNNFIVE